MLLLGFGVNSYNLQWVNYELWPPFQSCRCCALLACFVVLARAVLVWTNPWMNEEKTACKLQPAGAVVDSRAQVNQGYIKPNQISAISKRSKTRGDTNLKSHLTVTRYFNKAETAKKETSEALLTKQERLDGQKASTVSESYSILEFRASKIDFEKRSKILGGTLHTTISITRNRDRDFDNNKLIDRYDIKEQRFLSRFHTRFY